MLFFYSSLCGFRFIRVYMDTTSISAVVMDMDGVLWRTDDLLPGVHRWFDLLRERGLPFMLATNNSMKTPADYVAKFARLGVDGVQTQQILTSGTTTIDYLRQRYPQGTPVHIVGGDGLRALAEEAGFILSDQAAIVIAGLDTQLTYAKLTRAALLIRAGAEFIGTNDDRTIPTPEGLAPGAGSVIAALVAATDRQPLVMGKPNAPMFENALARLGQTAGRTLMIGDRIETDILGAQRVGMQTALVLTGVSTRAQAEAHGLPSTSIFETLDDLAAAFG